MNLCNLQLQPSKTCFPCYLNFVKNQLPPYEAYNYVFPLLTLSVFIIETLASKSTVSRLSVSSCILKLLCGGLLLMVQNQVLCFS